MAYTTIDDPSAYFQTALYTGTGSGQQVINDGNSDLQPDWIWVKRRDGLGYHQIIDSSRGGTKRLWANDNGAEGTQNNVASFDSDGFTAGDESDITPASTSQVAWQWKANGGTTSSNTDGSITSTVQANTTAGFSIVTYTGTGSTATVGHGLGSVPDMLIFKKRSAVDNWYVYHKSITNDYYLVLDSTDAQNNDVNIWNDTDPTSSVFSIANAGVHADGQTMVCYAFAEKQGYSKFGSYTGNGLEPDGPFIYTGFKPAWFIGDNKRDPDNVAVAKLGANTNAAESAAVGDNNWDFLSNGFKIRTQDDAMNKSGVNFIYMAFAESPFVSSEGVPTTAR